MTTDAQSRAVDGKNLSELLMNRVAATPTLPAFMSKLDGAWQTLTWGQVGDRASEVAHGLLALGVQPGDRVAIIGNTRQEWSLCDFGLVLAGGVTVPIYPSSPAETCVYILNDSESAWVFVENDKQLAKLLQNRPALPQLRRVILWDGAVPAGAEDWVTRYAELIERGVAHRQSHAGALAAVQASQTGDSTATIIYTSGTTGNPKGVVVAHDAYTVGCRYVRHALPVTEQDLQVLFLPLSHSFAKAIEIAAVNVGFCTAFAESIDKLADNCGEVKPTFVCAVPRVFEKAYARILNNAKEGGALKSAIFQRALSVGLRCSRMLQHGETPAGWLAMQYALADRLVFSKLRQRFGGRLRFFISGSAPLSKELAEFFHAAGLLILEGYGLTETNSMTSVNRLNRYKFGTVGQLLHPDLEIRLAADGEILTRGVTNLRSYYKQPEATREAVDSEGWLHTGDIAKVDDDGYFYIVDRKKDMIIASGYKILPREVEEVLYAHPAVQEVAVAGVPDAYRGETVKAYIVLKAGASATEEEIVAHCRASLAPYKVPKLIEFRAELPKTAIGKVLRRILVAEEQQKLSAVREQAVGAERS